ncbi:MAG: hypothetical protein ACU83N_11720 [Gammaproteobacteria bacterium]
MNKPYYRCKQSVSIIVPLTAILLLTACAGQQAAKELAGLEISTLMEYKKIINQSIAAENNYYRNSLNTLRKNLTKMNSDVSLDIVFDTQAKYYNHLWQKTSPSQYNVLELIDAVYSDYEKTNKELETHLQEIDRLYFSKITKLSLQQDNINKSIAALTKLYMGDDLKDQADLVKDYMVNTAKTVKDTTQNNDQGNINGQ